MSDFELLRSRATAVTSDPGSAFVSGAHAPGGGPLPTGPAKKMRIVTLEEHFIVPDLADRIDPAAAVARGWPGVHNSPLGPNPPMLADIGAARLAAMDKGGVSVQVLSVAGPGADLMSADRGPELARAFNDRLKKVVDEHPTRYAGFAHLPTTAPEAAADELQRAVEDLGFCGALINGMTGEHFLDHPSFDPILARAAKLDVPLYLHPNIPLPAISKLYYGGLPGIVGVVLGTGAWGWHSETALHVLRLVASGALERHPSLKLIVGHMGEGLPTMLDRSDELLTRATSGYLKRSVRQTILDQVWITTSGFFTLAPFMAALLTFGADRILFSVDYPFSSIDLGTRFLEQLPISDADRSKIAHGNADRLLKLS